MKGRAEHFGIGIPCAGMADPLEASIAGREECLDHRPERHRREQGRHVR